MVKRDVAAAMRVVKNHSIFTPFCFISVFYNNLFSVGFHFYVATEMRIQHFTVFAPYYFSLLVLGKFYGFDCN